MLTITESLVDFCRRKQTIVRFNLVLGTNVNSRKTLPHDLQYNLQEKHISSEFPSGTILLYGVYEVSIYAEIVRRFCTLPGFYQYWVQPLKATFSSVELKLCGTMSKCNNHVVMSSSGSCGVLTPCLSAFPPHDCLPCPNVLCQSALYLVSCLPGFSSLFNDIWIVWDPGCWLETFACFLAVFVQHFCTSAHLKSKPFTL